MKTNELRLGNLVMYNNQIVKTTGIHYGMFECVCPDDNNWMCTGRISEIHPIELTEEVLVKIGFGKENEVNRMYNNRCVISYYIDNFYNELVIEVRRENGFYKNNIVHYDIKYLHQLQNAYYCLTGQELEVEL